MKTFNLPFESYKAVEPLQIDSNGRKIILNGNRLAFLEPLEATAIASYLNVAQLTFDWVKSGSKEKKESQMQIVTSRINEYIHELHTFILWHYVKGSVYDTPFWKTAQVKTTTIFEQPNERFQWMYNLAKSLDYIDCRATSGLVYGQWPPNSIKVWYDKYIK